MEFFFLAYATFFTVKNYTSVIHMIKGCYVGLQINPLQFTGESYFETPADRGEVCKSLKVHGAG
jgi:hypothetical protein